MRNKITISVTLPQENIGKLKRLMKDNSFKNMSKAIGNCIEQFDEGFWVIPEVNNRDQAHTVQLSKKLLGNGNAKTQDEWAEYSRITKQINSFYTADFPLYNSLFTALFNRRNEKGTEEIRKFLKENFEKHWLTTLTRIKYAPKGLDEVIHNYNMPDQYIIIEDIISPDGYLNNIGTNSQPALNAVLGGQNTAETDDVYKWITGKDAYISRLNQKPEKTEERVAWFGAISVRADLSCSGDPSVSNSSLGVRLENFFHRK